MRRVVIVSACVTLVMSAGFADGASPRCPPSGAHVERRSSVAAVFKRRGDRRTFSCVRGSAPHALDTGERDGRSSEVGVVFDLSGVYGLLWIACTDTHRNASSRLVLINLKRQFRIVLSKDPQVQSAVVGPHGQAAWIIDTGDYPKVNYEVWVRSSIGHRRKL